MKTTACPSDKQTDILSTMPAVYATQGEAHGVNVLPWNDKIQLQALPPGTMASPLIKGSITFSNGVAPIFDLRTHAMGRSSDSKESCLLVVSMFNNISGPMLVGLLVNTNNGQLTLSPQVVSRISNLN